MLMHSLKIINWMWYLGYFLFIFFTLPRLLIQLQPPSTVFTFLEYIIQEMLLWRIMLLQLEQESYWISRILYCIFEISPILPSPSERSPPTVSSSPPSLEDSQDISPSGEKYQYSIIENVIHNSDITYQEFFFLLIIHPIELWIQHNPASSNYEIRWERYEFSCKLHSRSRMPIY